MTETKFTMGVDLSVVEALGINLYSNAAAVLSELVANAYDADATRISIEWKGGGDNKHVVVTDNGVGMTLEDINNRFLHVGYKKRNSEGDTSKKYGRPYMGRKGIGKLSVFSIADVVDVITEYGPPDSEQGEAKASESWGPHALRIVVSDLKAAIEDRKDYHPQSLPVDDAWSGPGTELVLRSLRKKRASLTANALRKRLARRFDVIDQTKEAEGGFKMFVNGNPITYADRQELKNLEFVWEFGKAELPDDSLPADVTRYVIHDNVIDATKGWEVKGWFGSAKVPTDLTSDKDAGSLKNIIVLARKRPIQEGIVDKLDFSRIFGNYVTGQIHADFLDVNELDDIATSDRQRLIEDDERVASLLKLLREAFVRAADTWSRERPKKEATDVLERYPRVREWVDDLPDWQRAPAEKMLGTIASLTLEKSTEVEQRASLLRAGILAFERIGLRKVARDLDDLADVNASALLHLLGAQDAYESALWVDILRSRIEAIDQFRNLADADEKEKVLQQHLFDHLWLIDPAWERAASSPRMEEDLRRIAPGVFPKDGGNREIKGRMDVRYATAGGKHVIVELKRYSVKPTVDDLKKQGAKYFDALQDVLTKQQRPSDNIEVVFVLGSAPKAERTGPFERAEDYIRSEFRAINGRYQTYDALIGNAQRQYAEYLEATDKSRKYEALLESLDSADNEDMKRSRDR